MNDIENIKHELSEWIQGLDEGNLERIVASCDENLVICNEWSAISHWHEAVRKKYGPLIENFDIISKFDIQHIDVQGDMAILVGHFINDLTEKSSGQKRGWEWRLIIVYRRQNDGSWKMILDVDNNDEKK